MPDGSEGNYGFVLSFSFSPTASFNSYFISSIGTDSQGTSIPRPGSSAAGLQRAMGGISPIDGALRHSNAVSAGPAGAYFLPPSLTPNAGCEKTDRMAPSNGASTNQASLVMLGSRPKRPPKGDTQQYNTTGHDTCMVNGCEKQLMLFQTLIFSCFCILLDL